MSAKKHYGDDGKPNTRCKKCGVTITQWAQYCRKCMFVGVQTKPSKLSVSKATHADRRAIALEEARKAAYCTRSPTKAHHWMLDIKSHGICRYCSEERKFRKTLVKVVYEAVP